MRTLSYRDPAPAGSIAVSLDRIMVGGLLLQAGSGAGKTTATRQLLEETHGRVQHLVIDPEGEFGSLRERFDYVYAAPNGGDVVATPKTARLLCRRLVELGASAVIDIYDLKLHEKREFVRLLLEELMSLPRSLWKPILLVVDEADAFFPQQGESSALEAGIDFNGRGRKRGYRGVFTTRRLSKLHKDVADVQNRMIGQTGLDLDVKRAGDELGMDKEARAQLPRLEPGSFFVYGPAISPTPILARSGTTTTTQPKPGAIGKVMPPAPAKVRAFIAQLADLPKAAEEEAKSLEDLRQENAGLKRQLRAAEKGGLVKEKPVADPAAIAAAVEKARATWTRELRSLVDRQLRVVTRTVEELASVADRIKNGTASVQGAVAQLGLDLGGQDVNSRQARGVVQLDDEMGTGESTKPRMAVVQSSRAPARPIATPSAHVTDLPKGQQKLLDAAARFASMKILTPTRTQLAALAPMSPTSSTTDQHFGTLVKAGLLEVADAGRVRLTDAGRALAAPMTGALYLEEYLDAWRALLSGSQVKLFDALVNYPMETVSRTELARLSGVSSTSSTTDAAFGWLIGLELFVVAGVGLVKAGPTMFPEGLD